MPASVVGSSGVLSERLKESVPHNPPTTVVLEEAAAAVAATSDKRPLFVWIELCCFSFDCLCSSFYT